MTKYLPLLFVTLATAQQADIKLSIIRPDRPTIALPDIRGTGDAQPLMNGINAKLFTEIEQAAVLKIAPKGLYPLTVPQQPTDFKPPTVGPNRQPLSQGPWLTDWSGAPVNANYLAYGYTTVQGGRLALFGWLYDVTQKDIQNAQVFGKVYFGTLDEAGAKKVALEFAADILARFGGKSLAGSRMFFEATSITKMDQLPGSRPAVHAKATNCPSGCHDGFEASPRPSVKRSMSVPSKFMRYS